MNTHLATAPEKEIRALHNHQFIRVYQAFTPSIARQVIEQNTFNVPGFKVQRTTWIKPSFLWMMYRCGWATKPNQEMVLGINLPLPFFNQLLQQSSMANHHSTNNITYSDWQAQLKAANVVIQWDPERDILLNRLNHRSIQIGLKPDVVPQYIANSQGHITDVTPLVNTIRSLLQNQQIAEAKALLPTETPYHPSIAIKERLGITV